MLYKGLNRFSEYGIFTDTPIANGTILFTSEEWVEDEVYGWIVLTAEEVEQLSQSEREKFLRYSYDVSFKKMIGTMSWENARHLSNFMNHSCSPNIMYDSGDNIIARRHIDTGEELTIDYGTFIVTIDQDFTCSCGSSKCRGRITRNDWRSLVPEYNFNFPTFMHKEIELYLEELKKPGKSA